MRSDTFGAMKSTTSRDSVPYTHCMDDGEKVVREWKEKLFRWGFPHITGCGSIGGSLPVTCRMQKATTCKWSPLSYAKVTSTESFKRIVWPLGNVERHTEYVKWCCGQSGRDHTAFSFFWRHLRKFLSVPLSCISGQPSTSNISINPQHSPLPLCTCLFFKPFLQVPRALSR